MHEGVIVVKNAGHDVPNDFIATIMKKYVGSAWADPEHNQVRVTRLPNVPIENINKAMQMFKDKRTVFFFGSMDELEQKAELQPFSILQGGQNNTLVAAFLDGNFSQFEVTGSTRYGQSLAVEKDIAPRISKLWKFTGELPKLWTELQDSQTIDDIVNTMVGDRGTITLLSADDEILHFSVATDESAKEYDWGWASDDCGWTGKEESVEAEASDDPMLAALAGSKSETVETQTTVHQSSGSRSGSRSNRSPQIADTTSLTAKQQSAGPPATGGRSRSHSPIAPDGKVTGPAVRTDGGIENGDGSVTFAVPAEIMKDPKKKAKWMRKRMEGHLPSNYMELTSITLKQAKNAPPFLKRELLKGEVTILKSFQGLKEMLMATVGGTHKPDVKTDEAPPKTEPAQPAPAVQPPQEAAPPRATGSRSGSRSRSGSSPAPVAQERGYPEREEKPAAKAQNVGGTVVVTVPTRSIPPAQKISFAEYYNSEACKTALDRHSTAISDPKTYEALVVKQPNFAQELKDNIGITSIWDTKNWPEEVLINMAEKTPHASMSFAISWRTVAIKQREKIEAMEKRINGLESQLGVEEQGPQPEQEVVPEKATGTHGSRSRSRA